MSVSMGFKANHVRSAFLAWVAFKILKIAIWIDPEFKFRVFKSRPQSSPLPKGRVG